MATAPAVAYGTPAPRLSRRGAATVTGVLTGLAALAVVVVWWVDPATRKGAGAGATYAEVGRASGLLAAVLLLAAVTLTARVRWLERRVGADWLVQGHRWLACYVGWLLVVHPVAIVVGYARNLHEGTLAEAHAVVDYPDVLLGTIGLALLALVLLLSARPVRRRLPYELWHYLHLLAYPALALAFAHQVVNGAQFFHRPLARALWVGVHVAVLLLVVAHRVVEPLWRFWRHGFRLADVVEEPDGSVSVYVTGRDLHALDVKPGQFFRWRFLTRGAWWQAHPFSLSQAPNGQWLRMTAKPIGDHSAWLTRLRPDRDVRVVLEGPYGALTPALRKTARLVLVGVGSGIAPMLALAQDAARRAVPATLVYRVSDEAQVNFRAELDRLAATGHVRVDVVAGPRGTRTRRDPLDQRALSRYVGNGRYVDVYLCGPHALTERLVRSLRVLGVPGGRIHTESFHL